MTPAGIEPATFRFVSQHLNHCATAVPGVKISTIIHNLIFSYCTIFILGRDGPVGTTFYGLDGPGIESQWGENLCTRPDQPCEPPKLMYSVYRVSITG